MSIGGAKDRATMIEIAVAAGVSKSTASPVLKGSESVHPTTLERVTAPAVTLAMSTTEERPICDAPAPTSWA